MGLTLLLALFLYSSARSMTVVNLLLINVFVESPETHAPVQGLDYSDFQVFDNGTPLEPLVFVSAASGTSRPVEIWFLASCPQQGQSRDGSGFAAGDRSAFKQALANLDGDSSVGVAHWCANGDFGTDLLPTQDREGPFVALEKISRQDSVEPSEDSSKRALQRALDLVIEKSRGQNPQALPVIVVLSDGSLGISKDDAELMAKRLLYRGAILYDVENRHEVSKGARRKEERAFLQSISRQTGGRVYSLGHEDYVYAMNSIIEGLRFRYTLGLRPSDPDGQWHTLRVRLTKAALRKHMAIRVNYPAGYLAWGSFDATPPYSRKNYRRATDSSVDNVLASLLDSPTLMHDILFDVKGHGFIGYERLVEFSLQLSSEQLSWAKLPNGDRRSEISIVVAGYSEDGRRLGHELIQFEIIRDESHSPITGDRPFSTSETIELPEHASRIRVAVRDATGKAGCQDFSLKEILSAPRSSRAIR
jgi:hypothetical protein